MGDLLLTESEGRTGEYWSEVVVVRTERSEVLAKNDRVHNMFTSFICFVPAPTLYFFIFLRFCSLNFAGVREKDIQKDRFHGNGPYCN